MFDADEFEISLPYDSKTMTGFVGLINNQRGEKAYASALIQMMFHIPCFWKAILEIPETILVKSLFLCLESSKTTVSLESLGITSNTLKKSLLEVFATVSEKMKVSYFLRNLIVYTVDALMWIILLLQGSHWKIIGNSRYDWNMYFLQLIMRTPKLTLCVQLVHNVMVISRWKLTYVI